MLASSSMPSHSAAACALLFSTLIVLLLLAGTAAAPASKCDVVSGNETATITSGGNSSSSGTMPAVNNGDDEVYTCYLCAGRNPLMIRWCPIYWDKCHLNCETNTAASAATVAVRDSAGSGPVSSQAVVRPDDTLDDDDPSDDDDECYVMKLYDGGRYVIVEFLKCSQVISCVLTCGGGDAPPAPSAAPVSVRAAFQDPRHADFERCGDSMVRRSGNGSYRIRKG